MLDTLLDLFERDKKSSKDDPGKKRSLRDRLSSVLESDDMDDSRSRRDSEPRSAYSRDEDDDDNRGRNQSRRDRQSDLLEFD